MIDPVINPRRTRTRVTVVILVLQRDVDLFYMIHNQSLA